MLARHDPLFARLAQNEPDLKSWLEGELAEATQVLIQNADEVQVRRAQGKAQHVERMLRLLDPRAAKRTTP